MNRNDFEDYSVYGKETMSEIAANIKAEYDEKYILKALFLGKTREDLAKEFNHKSYRTLDMYMRRRGYVWDSMKQNYVEKPLEVFESDSGFTASKVDKIISLFNTGLDPREIAKRVGMKDHRTMAMYMKDKGYVWSSEKQNYILLRGEILGDIEQKNDFQNNVELSESLAPDETFSVDFSLEGLPKIDKLQKLLPMLEMLDRNKDKLAELLSINEGSTIPRYVIGGITITKSLCMSHPLAELIKDFSKEKNISQREIFEVSIIEFLRKYGYENEVKTLFGS
ncbi:hypothetical protein GOM49_12730 [Clostridium bovifaecis]|uniref:Uncharacterized protein n=1 Tax=Clostridium bovifaecis TaxID=2184719 RepID=A0A6I6EY17_9CLOT|nr:hypothetical protein GOM49_12730 [Clostridium bovifaecis]